jgi:hypothetical protein
VKRYFIIAFVFVAALIAGALGFLGRHFNDVPRAVDAWLREAWYKLQNEPIDPEQAVTQVAESAVPITAFAAGCLVLLLIVLLLRGLRKVRADHLPGARRRRRTRRIARTPRRFRAL